MALHITLVKTPGNIPLSRDNHIFDQRGGTLGRADNNTWVLPDPEKFLSSCHCEIVFADDQFYLEDRSTNGTFVNGSFEPLGRGTRHQLRDGDYFEIGDYRFSIQVAHHPQGVFTSPFDASPAPPSVSMFDDARETDLFRSEQLEAPSLFNSPQDPLALWDKLPPLKSSPLREQQHFSPNKASNSLLDDFVGIDKPNNVEIFSSMSIGSGIDQAVSWPSAISESLIPEDWADDLMAPMNMTSQPTVQPPKTPPKKIAFEAPKPNVRIPLAERILEAEKMSSVEQSIPAQLNTRQTAKEKPNPALTSAEVSANRVLIEALGLDMSRISDSDMIEISRATGMLMREIIDGMLGVLRSRASIKNEFRMNVTTIQPIENNPLKFSVCVDDALENLFIKKSNAYKKPVEAFREGFQEIAEHQLAMIAGIRQGFEAMMERFDPEQLEKTFSKQMKASVIPGMKNAKFWNSYTEYYQGFTDNMEFSFQHLFGSDFVNAYEDQLRRLTAARKRGDYQDE